MATGIPPKTKTVKRKIPVVVSYDGKVNVDEILESSYHTFEKIYDVNGTGENHFYCGDNKDALLYLLNNGYKGKVKLDLYRSSVRYCIKFCKSKSRARIQ